MLVLDRQRELADWLGAITNGTYSPDTARLIGLELNGEISVVVACTDFNGTSCQYHIGIAKIAPVWFLKFCFNYGFNTLGLKRILTVVDSSNTKSLRYSSKVGFVIEHEIEDAGKDGGSLFLLSMYRHQCKYL